ncbi:agamous-like MADS-box protein AGL80 [Diospyros lotus]|uniref:agamous-like MADS-box protein AGL80 n=1 Tax=Diospyros lotus TaxID=55363 RepID=UPI002254D6E7|nr:agamous-like MADS-box protein AGL80 [Diospyros lotus]
MPRKKLELAWIVNDSARKATLKRRKEGFSKKAKELSSLCDAEVGFVLTSQDEAQRTVWPSEETVKPMFDRLLMMMSPTKQTQKMENHESYLFEVAIKEVDAINRGRKKNNAEEAQEMLNRIFEGTSNLDPYTIEGLDNLVLLMDEKLKLVGHKEVHASPQQAPTLPQQFPMPPFPQSIQQMLMDNQWFMETFGHQLESINAGPSGGDNESQQPPPPPPSENVVGTSGSGVGNKEDNDLPPDHPVFPAPPKFP